MQDFSTQVSGDQACFHKAIANHEPTFTLRAQDVLAPTLTIAWGDAQRFMEEQVKEGRSVVEVLIEVERRFSVLFPETFEAAPSDKVDQAYKIAEAMNLWPGTKKVAD